MLPRERGAALEHAVESHLNPRRPSTWPTTRCPTGREEIWRFTPLKRLRGLLDGEPSDGAPRRRGRPRCPRASTLDSRSRADEARGARRARAHRPAARAPGRRARRRRVAARRPRRGRGRPSPIVVRAAPATASTTLVCGPRWSSASARHAKATVVLAHTGSRATLADHVESLVGDGAAAHRASPLQDWADDAVHLGRSTRSGSAATRRVKHVADHLRRRPGPHARQRRVRRPRRRRPSCSASTSPTPASTSSTGSSSTTPRRSTKQPRDLQGRAAGPGRAHRLDRQRADPQGRRGHRDLRGEPQPGAHRRLPGRLGAQPRDRDRRDRGRRPRLGDRPLRRRAAVLPALARHRGEGGPPPGRARLLQRPDPQDRRPELEEQLLATVEAELRQERR